MEPAEALGEIPGQDNDPPNHQDRDESDEEQDPNGYPCWAVDPPGDIAIHPTDSPERASEAHRCADYYPFGGEWFLFKYEDMVKLVMGEVRQHFRPEFLNRLDEVIVFRSLVEEDLKQIIDLELDYARTRLKQHDIDLELTDEAKQWILKYVNEDSEGQDYGARPLRRAIEHKVEDYLSEEILRHSITEKDTVKVRVKDGHLFFDVVSAEKPKEESQDATIEPDKTDQKEQNIEKEPVSDATASVEKPENIEKVDPET